MARTDLCSHFQQRHGRVHVVIPRDNQRLPLEQANPLRILQRHRDDEFLLFTASDIAHDSSELREAVPCNAARKSVAFRTDGERDGCLALPHNQVTVVLEAIDFVEEQKPLRRLPCAYFFAFVLTRLYLRKQLIEHAHDRDIMQLCRRVRDIKHHKQQVSMRCFFERCLEACD